MARRNPYHFGQTNNGFPQEYYSQDENFETETENDHLVNGLRTKVSALKRITIDMGDEIKSQNLMLKDMDNDFDSTWGFLSSSMGRVKKLALAGHNRYICYLLLFAIFVFLFIAIIIRFR